MENNKRREIYINNIQCNNCGEFGHHVRDCRNPNTSLGIIIYRIHNNTLEYLMVCRRNTIGFVQFIRGKYVLNDINYIQKLFDVMTNEEVDAIKNSSFDDLWEILWLDKKYNKTTKKTTKDLMYAYDKYSKIYNGYEYNNKNINIDYFINRRATDYYEQEWGFPKGKRNNKETNLDTAIREFCEETGIEIKDINFGDRLKTFSEQYRSYDNTDYRAIYYLAEYNGDGELSIDDNKKEQYSEISRLGFYNLDECLDKIRDYNAEKKEMLIEVDRHIRMIRNI